MMGVVGGLVTENTYRIQERLLIHRRYRIYR